MTIMNFLSLVGTVIVVVAFENLQEWLCCTKRSST
jgi:hypothetical protein